MMARRYSWAFAARVLIGAGVLFIVLNVLFALLNPLTLIGHLTIYNWLVPGRERLPYGASADAYNLSLNSLEAMFASHVIAEPKRADEFRVVLIGDSSVWGVLLRNEQTLAGNLNQAHLQIGGRTLRAYNLGHPIMSVTKDLMLLDQAMQYAPDLIVWLVSLDSLPRAVQLAPPLAQNNPTAIRSLISRFGLPLDPDNPKLITPDFLARTLVGQRRALADWWHLQLYGVAWANTGIDQAYDSYAPRTNDFEADLNWQSYKTPTPFSANDLAFDVLDVGQQIVGNVPLMLINEPIFIADGKNSDIRYNVWYPRWAYDRYRVLFAEEAKRHNWPYLDLWDRIAPTEFTNSPVHLMPNGSAQLSQLIAAAILALNR